MDLSSKQRIIIISVFALYTAALLIYSLVTRKSLKEGKGDYLSKFYTGGRSGGIIITAMMVSAGVAGAGVFMGVPGFTYTFGATWMVCCFFSIGSNLMVLGLLGKRVGIVARRTNSKTFIELSSPPFCFPSSKYLFESFLLKKETLVFSGVKLNPE